MRRDLTTLKKILFIAGLLVYVLNVSGKVYLGAPFKSGMIVQQKADVSFWGKAKANAQVTILPSWMETPVTCVSDEKGNWKAKVLTPSASFDKYTIKFSDGNNVNTTVSNVLVGEVWVASGQSNMEMPVSGWSSSPIHNVDSILNSAAKYTDKLRFVTIPASGSRYPLDSTSVTWQKCSKTTINSFSVVSYFFATHLIDSLNIPVGIINSSYGGSSLETWIPTDVNESFGEIVMNNSTYVNIDQRTPSACYNSMINPIKGYTASGFLWYQGENNAYSYQTYSYRLCRMIDSWRKAWGQDNMKFYLVELTPYSYGNVNEVNGAFTREQQNLTQHVMEGVRMVCTNDLVLPNETEQIHPSHKLQVGQRLGDFALYDLFGFNIRPENPEMKSVEFKNGKAYVSFTHVERGFNITKDIVGFELAGKDGVFYKATATIEGDQAVVRSASVSAPASVRYCFRNFVIGNLKNKDGLPIIPFRSDNSPIRYVALSVDGTPEQIALSKAVGYHQMNFNRYEAGTDPGFTEQTSYNQYKSLLQDAQDALQTETTSENLSKIKNQLEQVSSQIESNTISLTEGYYQIVSGYAPFLSVQGSTKAMYGGISGSVGWSTLGTNNRYIFKLTKADGEYWKIQCLGTQTYIEPPTKNDVKVLLTENPTSNFIIEKFYKGQWGFISTAFDQELTAYGSMNGGGTSGNVQAVSGKYNSPSSWYLRKITDPAKIESFETTEIRIQVEKKLQQCKAINNATFVGTCYGDVSQNAKDSFSNSIAECQNYQSATKAELLNMLEKLDESYATFCAARKNFETNVWYYVVNMDTTKGAGASANDKSFYGNALCLKTNNTQDSYRWLASRDIAGWGFYDYNADSLTCIHNPYAMWRICPIEGNDSCFAFQNRATGTYLSGTLINSYHGSNVAPQPFQIQLLGRGQFHIISSDKDNVSYLPLSAIATNNGVANAAGGLNQPSAWNFVPVSSDDVLEYVEIDGIDNTLSIQCLPYAVSGVTSPNTTAKTYALNNLKDGTILELTEKQDFQPGEPFFLLLGNLRNSAKTETTFRILPPNSYTQEATTQNGVVGILDKTGVKQKGNIYFGTTDNAFKVMGTLTVAIEGHKGYIDPTLVTNKEGKVDLVVNTTSPDGISQILSDPQHIDVYSIDGKLLLRNVSIKDLRSKLGKGIYIVNKYAVVIN